MTSRSGYASIHGARLYYELAGHGPPLIMLHAGIADCRMWEYEFAAFAPSHCVLRYDMRGYGKSAPVAGDFNIQDDLTALLDTLEITTPLALMGCSMGGGLALEFALSQPQRVSSLVLVGADPRGFEADVAGPDALFAESEAAFLAGDIDRVAEIDMRIWFDGFGREPSAVNQIARQKAFDMARRVTEHELTGIGNHIRKVNDKPAAERLHELKMPTLVIVGENDLPFLNHAADYMVEHLPNATLAVMPDAAHLPNLEHPKRFAAIVRDFLAS